MSSIDEAMPRPPKLSPKLSIVVPAYNEQKLIAGALRSIHEAMLGCGCDDYELIVCDNASTDATAAIAAAEGARVVSEPHRQIGGARNTGARHASGEWLLFVDADSWPDTALIGDLLGTLERADVVGGGACLRCPGLAPALRVLLAGWNLYSRLAGQAAGSFLFCRREAFHAVGGFDSSLYATEELVLSKQLREWGRRRRMRFVILHKHRLSTSARKQSLYSRAEQWGLVLALLRAPRRVVRDRNQLGPWYDGRR